MALIEFIRPNPHILRLKNIHSSMIIAVIRKKKIFNSLNVIG